MTFNIKDYACIRVEDNLRHGNYRDLRVVEVEPTLDGWIAFLNSGPYGAGNVAKRTNRFAVESWERFRDTGVSDFGWRTFRKV